MRTKQVFLKLVQFFVSLAPLATYLIIYKDRFFTGEVVKNGWSCLIYVAFIFIFMALKDSMADLLKYNALLKISIVMAVMFYFFKDIAYDMMWMCIMTAIGGVLAMIPQYFAKEAEKDYEAERNGKAVAKAIERQQLSGRV